MTRIVTLGDSPKTVARQHHGQTVKPVKSRFVCMHLQRMRGCNLSDPDHPTVSQISCGKVRACGNAIFWCDAPDPAGGNSASDGICQPATSVAKEEETAQRTAVGRATSSPSPGTAGLCERHQAGRIWRLRPGLPQHLAAGGASRSAGLYFLTRLRRARSLRQSSRLSASSRRSCRACARSIPASRVETFGQNGL